MKFISALLVLTASAAIYAQTTPQTTTVHAPTTVHRPATSSAAAACLKLPELSPKIPALPPGLPCAKPLYTISTVPSVRLDYTSPLTGPGLRETLGIEPSSFSLGYIDVKPGTGEGVAPHKWLSIHYTGYLIDGTKFDSSIDRGEPIAIPYGDHHVISGWDTGFDGMKVGAKRRLFIPFQLAYGPNGQKTIPPKAMLIFDVELVKVSDTEPPHAAPKPVVVPPTSGAAPAKPATPPAGAATPPATAPATDPTKPTAVPSTTPPPTSPKP